MKRKKDSDKKWMRQRLEDGQERTRKRLSLGERKI